MDGFPKPLINDPLDPPQVFQRSYGTRGSDVDIELATELAAATTVVGQQRQGRRRRTKRGNSRDADASDTEASSASNDNSDEDQQQQQQIHLATDDDGLKNGAGGVKGEKHVEADENDDVISETDATDTAKRKRHFTIDGDDDNGQDGHHQNGRNDQDHGHQHRQEKRHQQQNTTNGKLLRERKRQKYEAKQERLRQQSQARSHQQDEKLNCHAKNDDETPSKTTNSILDDSWLERHSEFAHRVTKEDIDDLLPSCAIVHVDECDTSSAASKTGLETMTSSSRSSKDDDGDQNEKQRHHHRYLLQQLLSPYINIKDGGRNSRTQQQQERFFIAEGTETIRILIQQQKYRYQQQHQDRIVPKLCSIFVKPSILFDEPVKLVSDIDLIIQLSRQRPEDRNGNQQIQAVGLAPEVESTHRESFQRPPPPPIHVLVGNDSSVLSQVAGFQIGRGALACGTVPHNLTEEWLDEFICNKMTVQHASMSESSGRIRLLALDGICDTANMGSMIRTASALGVDAIVLSSDCCDEWYRRSVRVSMGHIFLIPVVRVSNLASFLNKWSLKRPEEKIDGSESLTSTSASKSHIQRVIHSYAAVVDPTTSRETLVLEGLPHGSICTSWCCVLGNEGNGISDEVVASCTDTIRIGMKHGVDSLSVVIACGILLHGLSERTGGI